MEHRVALLVTDRPDESTALVTAFDRVVACSVLKWGQAWAEPVLPLGIVADIDLARTGATCALQKLRVGVPSAETPLLVLMRSRSDRSFATAKALGASICLPDRTPATAVVETFLAHTAPGRVMVDLVVERAVGRAGDALDCLLSAARAGDAVDVRALETGVGSVLDAVAEGGLVRWLELVWTFDDATYQHCLLVAGLAAAFASHLGCSTADRLHLVRAALVHDVGKARVPLAILNKPGRLDPDELAVMRTHAAVGHEILQKAGGFDAATLDVVRHHHEMLDGSGYPDGLRGEAVSDRVRLITLCDIYAALIERRPYRAPMTAVEALQILRAMGEKLDSDLLKSFSCAMALGAAVAQ